jgi:pteridine reductase
MEPRSLAGKTALVTGAARRIGRAIALCLAERGANVVLHYRRSAEEGEALVSEIASRGAKSWLVPADFERGDDYGSLVARAMEAAGGLDVLVNSASIFLPSTIFDADLAGFQKHLEVNAWVPLVLAREFAARAKRGKIVNVLDARLGGHDPAHVSYIVSKHALAALTRMMAIEFAPAIAVNAVAPGLILPPPGKDEGFLAEAGKSLPLERHGDPSDIARAVLYLLESDFVTGEVLRVDGGYHLKGNDHG